MSKTSHFSGLPLEALQQQSTPLYCYDMALLEATLNEIQRHTGGMDCKVHYAVKANGNPRILSKIAHCGLGADLVSGGEIQAAIDAGFSPEDMNYSGVGKTDWEIRLGLKHGIGCFNVESVPELEVIDALAREMGTTAPVAIRVNPDIDAHTHRYITTGMAGDKFGIGIEDLDTVVDLAMHMSGIHLRGLHFHIGSQITDIQPFAVLCDKANDLIDHYEDKGVHFELINVGGGLGIDYEAPDQHPMADFASYFSTFRNRLRLRSGQQLHFELGRAIVGNCGSLIARVVYVKESRDRRIVILDAGMNDLIRPALYGATHQVQNLTATASGEDIGVYDIVGPVCESSDVFAHGCRLPLTRRGDLIAIRSAGAYGESMASTYNMRSFPGCFFFPDESE